jgi:hypothetical protein
MVGIFFISSSFIIVIIALGSAPILNFLGGGGEIRTHDTVSSIPLFESGPFNHSGTPPCPREELNSHFVLRTDLFYPLNYEGIITIYNIFRTLVFLCFLWLYYNIKFKIMANLYSSMVGFGMMGALAGVFGILFIPLLIWSIVWKGLALWQAARRGDKIWFVVLLVINTVGILEILYLYVFSKKRKPTKE